MNKTNDLPPILIDPHFSSRFYSELWGISVSTVERWFEDRPGVLKLGEPSKHGKRTRVELRIPMVPGVACVL